MTNESGSDWFPKHLLNKAIEERRQYFRSLKISHIFLKQAVDQSLFWIRSIGSEGIVFICGPTGVGKKELVRLVTVRIYEVAMPKLQTNKGCIPVANVEASAPEQGSFDFPRLWKEAIKELNEPLVDHKISYYDEVVMNSAGQRIILSKTKKADYRDVLRDVLKYRETSALIINEAHHMLKVASGKKVTWEVDSIKSLVNKCATPIVLVGTYELLTILEDLIDSSMDQINRRARLIEFPRYRPDSKVQVEAYGKTIKRILRQMPLVKSPENLVDQDFMYFYKYTLGCVGTLKEWLNSAYDFALLENAPTLTRKHLDETRISGHRSEGILNSIIKGEVKMKKIQSEGDLDKALCLDRGKAQKTETNHKETVKSSKALPGTRKPGRDQVGLG
ncbi:hypothetical protein Desde_3991 [Desulfitobacterium dehalogenans ATCC 51507]|uniref:ORC1/DEAH AAA+ ATPase domain-containing protein n=1 Tax=Desulfitobacterium dehalogenans (strain ATCC 51507 / DSM 9161 / JW/IU-DC1) TaxID=756499 RepID=I4AE69_DESDJ|nr:ATP-binding protein [Desulfitobacterium dehalogenans]AFM02254.1 hypothetical protein Desde_3991 [Desulfitobacterium dehalogenans ATCC 51507]